MSNVTKVVDTETGEEHVFPTMSKAAEWLYQETGRKASPAGLYRCEAIKRLYHKRYRIQKLEGPLKRNLTESKGAKTDKKATKDGWSFWQGASTPSIICMERVLPYYDAKRFETIKEALEPFKCHVYFDITDDEYAAKKRTKCRMQIYRKLENMTFDEKVEEMLKMFH